MVQSRKASIVYPHNDNPISADAAARTMHLQVGRTAAPPKEDISEQAKVTPPRPITLALMPNGAYAISRTEAVTRRLSKHLLG